MSGPFHKLAELFKKFPGIGPRQAERFVYFLLSQNDSYIKELVAQIEGIKKESAVCESCQRFFSKNGSNKLCSICSDSNREKTSLVVVSRDADLENIERSGAHHGLYFVLGGIVPVLEKEPEKRVRIKKLTDLVNKRITEGLSEIVLAMNATTEGENTGEYVEESLRPILKKHNIKISRLGRGLSTGLELEYSDKETITNALKNRA